MSPQLTSVFRTGDGAMNVGRLTLHVRETGGAGVSQKFSVTEDLPRCFKRFYEIEDLYQLIASGLARISTNNAYAAGDDKAGEEYRSVSVPATDSLIEFVQLLGRVFGLTGVGGVEASGIFENAEGGASDTAHGGGGGH